MKLITLILIATISLQSKAENEGKRLYITKCAGCHNLNPNKNGSVGPDLVTTPLDAFRVKVLQGKYPSGYAPKRRTKAMQKFQGLTNSVDLIYNYIQTFKGK